MNGGVKGGSLWRLAVLLCVFPALPDARAGEGVPLTGARLLEYCREAVKEKPADAFRAAYCMAFVDGTLRGWEAGAYARDASPNYCLPPALTLGQLVSVVSKYLDDNPADHGRRAEVVVITAVQRAYSCAPVERK